MGVRERETREGMAKTTAPLAKVSTRRHLAENISQQRLSVGFFGRRCGIGRVDFLKRVGQGGREFEVSNVLAGSSGSHEIQPDGERGAGSSFFCAERSLFVEAHPHAAGHGGREAD